jgi:hypothetical protein
VHVDEPRCDEQPARVDGLGRLAVDRPARDLDDDAVLHRDVTVEPVRTGAVDDRRTRDLQVVHPSPSNWRQFSAYSAEN